MRAAQYWLAGHPAYAGHDIAFDVVLAAPWTWPRYIENAFPRWHPRIGVSLPSSLLTDEFCG